MIKISLIIHELTNKTQGWQGERERKRYGTAYSFQKKKNNKWSPVVFICNLDPLKMTSYWKKDSLSTNNDFTVDLMCARKVDGHKY